MRFEVESISPISFLAKLREEVLKRSLKRMPKWKFRLASDLVLQLQPKPTVMLSEAATARGFKPKLQHFEGTAVMTENVTSAVFKQLPRRPCPPWWQLKFDLFAKALDADWMFKPAGGRWQGGADAAGLDAIKQRLMAGFRSRLPRRLVSRGSAVSPLRDLRQGPDRPGKHGEMDRSRMRGHVVTACAVRDRRQQPSASSLGGSHAVPHL